MRAFLFDLRYSLRVLARAPMVTFIALAALALGIGVNTAIFSVVYAVVLKPLPYAAGGRLYQIAQQNPAGKLTGAAFPDFLEWRDRAKSLEMLSTSTFRALTMAGVREPENLYAQAVSSDLFPLLGIQPLAGRWFTEEDFRPGAPQTAILSYRLWQRSFAGDRDVIGRSITLNGRGATVAGVMPAEFQYPHPAFEIWIPWQFTAGEMQNGTAFNLRVAGRLKPGISIETAIAELNALTAGPRQKFPTTHRDVYAVVTPMSEKLFGDYRLKLMVLLGAVVFILLIACANIANLLLARAASRSNEIAIRTALGASRWRIARQTMAESLVLAVAGGLLGILIASWASAALISFFPGANYVPRLDQTRLDAPVLLFALAASLATGFLFGAAPAWRASRLSIAGRLNEGGRGNAGSSRNWMRSALVVSEIAFSLILLAGAGVMLRSFLRLIAAQPGFHTEHILTVKAAAPGTAGDQKQVQRYGAMLGRIRALPGVTSAAVVSALPLGNVSEGTVFYLPQDPNPQRVALHVVSPEYFKTMSIPLLAGRVFTDADDQNAKPVAVVSETLARRYWPGENPIGKRANVGGQASPQWIEIAGVVADTKVESLSDAPKPQYYRPFPQFVRAESASLVIRTTGDPVALAPAVREAIHSAEPSQPIGAITSMAESVRAATAQPRFYTALLALFAALAVLLAAAGVYGVMAYTVTQRRHELGVRAALGASPAAILRLVIGQGAWQALAGIALGLAGAFGLTRFLSAQLYGVTATDPLTFAAVSTGLLAVALAATYFPARRAATVDPMETLRHE